MTKLHRRRVTALAIGVTIAILTAACGSSGVASETGDRTTSTTGGSDPASGGGDVEPSPSADAQGAVGSNDSGAASDVQGISKNKVIKLGAWAPKTGPIAGAGLSTLYGGQLAFDELNEAGGVNGYTIELQILDDASDPTRTVRAVRSLWKDEEIFALFLPYGSSPNQAARQYVMDNEIPLLFPYADSRIYFEAGKTPPENVFGFYPPYGSFVDMLVGHAVEKFGIKTLGVFYTQDLYGQAGADGAHAAAEKYGLNLLIDVNYASSETNFASIGRKIADSGADAMVAWAVPGVTQIMKAADDAGYKGKWLVQTGLFGDLPENQMKEQPSLKDRTFMAMFEKLRNDGDPEVDRFFEEFNKRYEKWNPDLAAMGWTQGLVLIDAIKRATDQGEPLTWDSLRASLEQTSGLSVGAGVGITYTPDNHFGSHEARIYVWDGSKWYGSGDFSPLPGVAE